MCAWIWSKTHSWITMRTNKHGPAAEDAWFDLKPILWTNLISRSPPGSIWYPYWVPTLTKTNWLDLIPILWTYSHKDQLVRSDTHTGNLLAKRPPGSIWYPYFGSVNRRKSTWFHLIPIPWSSVSDQRPAKRPPGSISRDLHRPAEPVFADWVLS